MKEKRKFKILLSLDKFEMQSLKDFAHSKGIALASLCRVIIREKLNISQSENDKNQIFN
ncbi:MAG: hypothetical protein V1779_11280 [bacterium]